MVTTNYQSLPSACRRTKIIWKPVKGVILKGSLNNNEKVIVHPIAGHDGTKREYRFISTLPFICFVVNTRHWSF